MNGALMVVSSVIPPVKKPLTVLTSPSVGSDRLMKVILLPEKMPQDESFGVFPKMALNIHIDTVLEYKSSLMVRGFRWDFRSPPDLP